MSCQVLFILLTYKHFHHFTPKNLLFFPFVVPFKAKVAKCLRHAAVVGDLAWSYGLIIWVHKPLLKIKPIPLVQKSLKRVRFAFCSRKSSVFSSRFYIKPFVIVNKSNSYVSGYVWLYSLKHEHLLQVRVLIN